MFSELEIQLRQILTGNFLLIGCCIFYLAWWLIAFKPQGAVTGMKSGWLLIPAVILGLAAIVQIVRGSAVGAPDKILMPRPAIYISGIAAYVILLVISRMLMDRPVTTELLLIIGWGVLAFLEINALYGFDLSSAAVSIIFFVVIVAAAAIGIFCYLRYYNLDARMGYIDGMIPLLLIAVVMAVVSAKTLLSV